MLPITLNAGTTGVQALCLAGPTAVGKTAVALALAELLPLEIISVDSALVYRGMDIGTAKPSAAERAAVPHHLIDIVEPTQAYSAALLVADAQRLITDIRSRGRLPLLVGGTMLYFKALRDGLDPMPSADPAVRAQLDLEAAARGWPALHAELATVDPVTAQRLAPNDAQRIQRALEVWRVSGKPLSAWQQGERSRDMPGDLGGLGGDPHDDGAQPATGARSDASRTLPLVSLEPVSRAWLHARIAARFDAMLAAGLMDEVRGLRARADLQADMPSMRCVGYRQAWAALDADDAGAARPSAVRELGIAATRQLAKRQLTWLRSMSDRHVVAADAPDAMAQALRLLQTLASR